MVRSICIFIKKKILISVKKTDTFTKFERAWISILILSIIIAVAARYTIPPKIHPPEDFFIFTQEIVTNFYQGQIYAFTEQGQEEVVPSCENFLERWVKFPEADMANYTMHNKERVQNPISGK